jgi:hypothetical protein
MMNFLNSFNIDGKIAVKILIDKWLHNQPVFRGKLTKNYTLLGLNKLFLLKDKRVENLIVIAYNPSHANTNNGIINLAKP